MSAVGDHASSAQRVYEYWFVGDQQVNYRTKWFPAGSKDIQGKADTHVFEQFGELFDQACAGNLNDWKSVSVPGVPVAAYLENENNCRPFIALILLLDQFSRHIYRKQGLEATDPRRSHVDAMALQCAEEYTSISGWETSCSAAEFVFLLMPFRHSATMSRLEYVMTCIDERIQLLGAGVVVDQSRSQNQNQNQCLELELELVTKFRKQTLRRLQHLQDRARAANSTSILEYAGFTMPRCAGDLNGVNVAAPAYHADTKLSSGCPAAPIVAEAEELELLSELRAHPLYMTTALFLQRHMSDSSNAIAVSLSGGVDSMVIAKILSAMRVPVSTCGRQTPTSLPAANRILGIHIDYANRDESGREAAFVQEWCEQHNIECHTRAINEVTRGITDRSQYEKVARDIRYGFYQSVGVTVAESEPSQARHLAGVIFGHHQGDLEENVISNVMRGSSPLLLSGMGEISKIHGVNIWRPLLAHSKVDIYAFAHRFGVPYFKDTTPSWSTRGKLRNQLLPLLRDMYGTGCSHNLRQLARMSDELCGVVQQNIYQPFMDAVKRFPCGVCVNVLPFVSSQVSSHGYWKEVLRQLMHSLDMSMVRERSVSNFVERIERVRVAAEGVTAMAGSGLVVSGWLELRKGLHVYLAESGELAIFKQGVIVELVNRGKPSAETESLVGLGADLAPTESAPLAVNTTAYVSEIGDQRMVVFRPVAEKGEDEGAPGSAPGSGSICGAVVDIELLLTHWCGGGGSGGARGAGGRKGAAGGPRRTTVGICVPRALLNNIDSNPITRSQFGVGAGATTMQLGSWRVSIALTTASTGQLQHKTGPSVLALLEGCFAVVCERVPLSWCRVMFLLANLTPKQIQQINDYCPKLTSPFQKMDPRLKLGLPLLVPLGPVGVQEEGGVEAEKDCDDTLSSGTLLVDVHYLYQYQYYCK